MLEYTALSNSSHMYRMCYIKKLFYFADKGMAQGNMAGPERYIILKGIVSHYAHSILFIVLGQKV